MCFLCYAPYPIIGTNLYLLRKAINWRSQHQESTKSNESEIQYQEIKGSLIVSINQLNVGKYFVIM